MYLDKGMVYLCFKDQNMLKLLNFNNINVKCHIIHKPLKKNIIELYYNMYTILVNNKIRTQFTTLLSVCIFIRMSQVKRIVNNRSNVNNA